MKERKNEKKDKRDDNNDDEMRRRRKRRERSRSKSRSKSSKKTNDHRFISEPKKSLNTDLKGIVVDEIFDKKSNVETLKYSAFDLLEKKKFSENKIKENYDNLKLSRREIKKLKNKKRKESTSSSSSSSSSSDEDLKILEKKKKKGKKLFEKELKKIEKKRKKKKKEEKKLKKNISKKKIYKVDDKINETTVHVDQIQDKKLNSFDDDDDDDRLLKDISMEVIERAKAMAPMTKEQWEKRQSVVRRVYDEESGRHRLIKGDGEILEEIVSRDRHRDINKQATRGDGEYFQSRLKLGK